MKKIFTLTAIVIFISVFFSGCIKNTNGYDEKFWLSKESGVVVYSDYCEYFAVKTAYGYSILQAWGSYKPLGGSIVYGDFSNYGIRDFYNRSSRKIFTADVKEYGLSYTSAQQAVYYYCPYGKNKFNNSLADTTVQKH